MAFVQYQSVKIDQYGELREKDRRLKDKIAELEITIPSIRDAGQKLIEKKKEYDKSAEEFRQLTNQDGSCAIKTSTSTDFDDTPLAARSGVSAFQTSLSWDFEGLSVKDKRPDNPGYITEVGKVISRMEQELANNKTELDLVQKQLQQYSGKTSRNDWRNQEIESERDQYEIINHVKVGDEGSATSSNNIQVLQETVNILKKRIEELLEVNHQWDEQYRLLKEDKDRTISELRQNAGTQGEDGTVGQNNDRVIAGLRQKIEELTQEIAQYQEKQQKTDQLWLAAKKMITEEREARAAASQQTQVVQERCRELENEVQVEKQTQGYLKQEIERLVSGGEPNVSGPSSLSSNMNEQIEMLKQQIRVYVDDFASERRDRERAQADREVLKEQLKACESDIALLKEQVRIYQDDFKKERQEKERVQRQLRDRRPVTIVQGGEEPWYMIPPNDYSASNPAQRRQPFYHERGYHGPASYSPREIQELAFQQQTIQHRGSAIGHPGALCHGCEADCDVIDGNSSQLKCPRCDRRFSAKERRAFDEHIDKCTT